MKVKKILPVVALTALTVVGLAACGAPVDPSSEAPSTGGETTTTVKVWATQEEHPVINSIVAKYNETATDKLAVELTAVAEGDAGTELVKDPTQEGAPDLFLTADDHIFNLQRNSIALEITGDYKTAVTSANSPVSITGSSYDGKLYGFPVTSDNGYFLWYNKAALTAEQVGSLETILEVAHSTGKKVLFEINNGWYANSFLMSPDACGTESLRWKSVDGKVSYETTWDNATGVAVCEAVNTLLQTYFENNTLIANNDDALYAGVENGEIIAAVRGTWNENTLKQHLGENLAATKLPTFNVGGEAYQMASFTGSKVYVVNKLVSVDQQKAAVKLAQLLTTKDAQIERFQTRATLPCNLEAAADARVTEHATIGGAALSAQNIAGAAVQSLTAEGRYWDVGKAIGQAYLDGNLGDCANWQEFLTMQMDALRQEI